MATLAFQFDDDAATKSDGSLTLKPPSGRAVILMTGACLNGGNFYVSTDCIISPIYSRKLRFFKFLVANMQTCYKRFVRPSVHPFLMLQLNCSVFVSVYGMGKGLDGGCMPLPPTRTQQYCYPASLVVGPLPYCFYPNALRTSDMAPA